MTAGCGAVLLAHVASAFVPRRTHQPGERVPGSEQEVGTVPLEDRAAELIELEIDRLLGELGGEAPFLERMARYHFGLQTEDGQAIPAADQRRIQGKRIRPMIALLTCAAAGGDMKDAAPLAAGIELLHNFTLIHDDIQDRSPNRRHRPTVWHVWGEAQAINAGDALFAAAQIGVLNSTSPYASAGSMLVIARAFNRMTIDIVRGQVLDLQFEGRSDVTPDDYLSMILGKTAAILEFAAWAGALLGGADIGTASRYAGFGRALGIGFQIRDDALGVWGTPEATGKDPADDIRRRKQSFPVILLRASASAQEAVAIDEIFGGECVTEDNVVTVLSMLEAHNVARNVEQQVHAYHDDAVNALDTLEATAQAEALAQLRHLTDRMADRSG
jgi:geranylgeranyl diphosphate synthase, type I